MKNEDRIVELLADSLKKQDQQNELLTSHSQFLDILVQGQAQLLLTAQETNRRLGAIEEDLKKSLNYAGKSIVSSDISV